MSEPNSRLDTDEDSGITLQNNAPYRIVLDNSDDPPVVELRMEGREIGRIEVSQLAQFEFTGGTGNLWKLPNVAGVVLWANYTGHDTVVYVPGEGDEEPTIYDDYDELRDDLPDDESAFETECYEVIADAN